MAKGKVVFFCKECGIESPKWLGQCPGCKAWNSLVEAPQAGKAKSPAYGASALQTAEPVLLSEVDTGEDERMTTGIGELDRVLGGGIVIGSLVLVGGDPGIGKSTLLLQMCYALAKKERKVLYVSGEESIRQIRMRADRLKVTDAGMLLLAETSLNRVEENIRQIAPEVVIIDSIQTVYREETEAAPGSPGQIKEATASLLRLAKGLGITIFIIGHVTKEGVVAGPRMLEHMVDTVLYFEGENHISYRILRAVKNRFGSTNEIGVFEMAGAGLLEVKNPSEYMLEGRPEDEPGSVVTAAMEGTRPILVEVQALVSPTNFNMPRRTAAGTDYNRVTLLMAVLEKRLGISLAGCDAYVNVAGGMKITEPALDLAIILALLSSYRNRPLPARTVAFGEVGLTGEVRSVNMMAARIAEAEKMGYKTAIVPRRKKAPGEEKNEGIRVVEVGTVQDLQSVLRNL
ncbi:MAG: DNA repair protein RadA [Lachnospiraceae bacterium]|nr:DNA repair protein RadA [Lachnospiraceae bacterium]